MFRLSILLPHNSQYHLELKWINSTEHTDIQRERQIRLKVFRGYSSDVAWIACSNVPRREATALLDELELFNFRILQAVPDGIVRFLPWLYSLVSSMFCV